MDTKLTVRSFSHKYEMRGRPSFFLSCFFDTFFICLFRMTFFDDFHDFLMTSFFYVAPKSHRLFLFVVFRPDPIYKYFGGRQTHVYAFSGRADLQEDAWRQS